MKKLSSEYSCVYLLFFLPGNDSVGDAVRLLLSSVEDEWDPWLEIECLIGICGIADTGFNLCEMRNLSWDVWGKLRNGGTLGNIGNKAEGGNPEFLNVWLIPG